MVGSSKILTVSYGTFSCTLEGFDDPFSTMRHIAEYFRDLAADDRYFGAEPPTPDAEMLHRIAEREIQRRVEARVTGESVVLRQLDTGLQEDEDDTPSAAQVGTMDDAAPDLAEATGQETDAEAEAKARADSIEDKLSRIRAVVDRTRSRDLGAGLATAVSEEPDADDEAMVADMAPGFAGDIDADLITQVMAAQDADDADRAPTDEPVAGAEWDVVAAQDADEDDAGEDAAAAIEAGDATADYEDDGTGEEDAAPATAVDEAADGVEPAAELPMEDDDIEIAAEIGGPEEDTAVVAGQEIGDGAEPLETEHVAAADDPRVAGTEEVEAAGEAVLEPAPQDDIAGGDHVEADDGELSAETDADTEAEELSAETDDDTAEEDDDLWNVDFDAEARAEDEQTLDLEDADGAEWRGDADGAPGDDSSLAAARAERTLSKSSQLRAPDEESERLESRTEKAFSENDGSRRRSAIAHLKAAVAATRADKILSKVVGRDRASDPEVQKDYREDLSKVVRSRPHPAPVATAEHEPVSPRADEPLDEAPTLEIEPMDDPVAQDSYDAITSRVKTRLLGPEDTVVPASDDDDARKDGKPSTLMLVSELRAENGEPASVNPRRVSRELTDEERAAGAEREAGFAAFAERMGASDLPDLMEAAAAYTAYVEGQPHFSRPQIMRRVAKVDPTIEDSREAGLRSFGQLLRQGRIQKLQRGQFTVSETTRFKPEQRYAGE